MKLIGEGKTYVSYRYGPGEKRPKVLPLKAPSGVSFRVCSHCKERGVFEYT